MADEGLQHGVKLSQTSPAFLHSNSTSHTWPFSALAELVDNAYDPDVAARVLHIDLEDRMGKTCLLFSDDGNGMTPDKLHKMLSFGYCEKVEVGGHKPVGHYGNGFKSGSMRLAKDAIVFTKSLQTMSVGFLSQSYLEAISATTVLVPMVTWNTKTMNVISENSTKGSIEAITQHSLFRTEKELLAELEELNLHKTGTRILLYNLKRGCDDKLELDLESNSKDIINSERQELDFSSALRPVMEHVPEYIRSFREYCSILFLKPRMKIMLRGYKVKTKLISKSLSQTEKDVYKPVYLPKPIKIIFGFSSSKEDFGMMMYHRNRLIKAYEHVGYQKQANELGTGVVGVVEVDFLEPVHNKQDFNKTDRYNSCISALGSKLNDYWNTKMSNTTTNQDDRLKADWTWVQCDNCLKWRRLPDGYTDEGLPDKWFCYMNNDPTHNRCDVDEEPEDEDELQRASYNKVKKKSEPRVSNDMMIRERRIAEKERSLMTMQQTLHSMEPLAPSGSGGNRPTIADLEAAQKELEQAREREQQQRSLIARLQHQGDKIVQGQNAMRSTFMARNSSMSTLNNIAKTGAVSNHGSQPSQRQGNSLVKHKRKMVEKEKIQLPGGDAVIVTRNDSTSSSSDDDDQATTAKRRKRPGLVVKMPKHHQSKPKINGETIVIDSDDEEASTSAAPTKSVSPDVKPDVNTLNKSIKKEKAAKSPEKKPRCPIAKAAIDKIFMSRMVQTDPMETQDSNDTKSGASGSNVKDSKENLELVQEKLAEAKSQLSGLRNNVGKLLQTILPDLVVDDVTYIDAIVREMVRVNKTDPVKNGNKTSKAATNGTGTSAEVPEESH